TGWDIAFPLRQSTGARRTDWTSASQRLFDSARGGRRMTRLGIGTGGLLAGAIAMSGCSGVEDSAPRASSSTIVKTSSTSCGNAVRDADEQCDDGNLVNLDGCDASCRFEQVHRFNSLTILFGTDPMCPVNAIGGAVGSVAQGTVQSGVTKAIGDGSIS